VACKTRLYVVDVAVSSFLKLLQTRVSRIVVQSEIGRPQPLCSDPHMLYMVGLSLSKPRRSIRAPLFVCSSMHWSSLGALAGGRKLLGHVEADTAGRQADTLLVFHVHARVVALDEGNVAALSA
jgi:hypothetical protein